MNPIIERRLQETAWQLMVARAIRFSAILLCLLTAALLAMGAVFKLVHVTNGDLAWGLIISVLLGGAFVWLAGVLVMSVAPPRHETLAREAERANPGLMDRLHTLLFLGPRRHVSDVESFAGRIEQQSALVMSNIKTTSAIPAISRDTSRWIAGWLVLMLVTLLFYQWFRPLSELGLVAATPEAPKTPELELPPTSESKTDALAEKTPWIETRILDPNADVVATRFESVPLLAEAATSGKLEHFTLHTSHNGEARPPKTLALGEDPQFTRQQQVVDLKQLQAADWDVVSSHAAAASSDGMKDDSRIVFIDVRPTQEEIEKLPGGADGEPYRLLNDLTGMVDAQQDAIREGHQLGQTPAGERTEQEMSELAQAEETLKTGVEYLSKSLPGSENLAAARKQLDQAAQALQESATQTRADDAKQATQNAQRALGRLATARREIHRAVKSDPTSIPSPLNSTDPLADLMKQLQQFNDRQDQLRTAAEEVAKMAEQQRKLADDVRPPKPVDKQAAAAEQKKLQQGFQEFRKHQSQACKLAAGQCNKAGSALSKSTSAMQNLAAKNNSAAQQGASRAANESAAALKQLAEALEQQAGNQENALARQLQRALDQQIQFLQGVQQRPEAATEEQLAAAAENMKSTTSELQKLANDPRTRDQFDDKLRDELSPENKEKLDGQCQGTCNNPGGGAGRKQAAGAARSGLQRVAQAMRSGDKMVSARQSGGPDRLRTDSSQALARARQQLESLMRSAQYGRGRPADQRQLLRDALRNMRVGMAPAGRGAASDDPTSALQEKLKEERLEIDIELLRRLLEQLDQVQIEKTAKEPVNESPNVTDLDPQNYPPGYRDWIQRYYRRLAEQP